jgi:hypothetical protein
MAGVLGVCGISTASNTVSEPMKHAIAALGYSSQLLEQARITRMHDRDTLFVEFTSVDIAEKFLIGTGGRLKGVQDVRVAYAHRYKADPAKRREQILRRFAKLSGNPPPPQPTPAAAHAPAAAPQGEPQATEPNAAPAATVPPLGNAQPPSEPTTSEGGALTSLPQSTEPVAMDTDPTIRKRTQSEAGVAPMEGRQS